MSEKKPSVEFGNSREHPMGRLMNPDEFEPKMQELLNGWLRELRSKTDVMQNPKKFDRFYLAYKELYDGHPQKARELVESIYYEAVAYDGTPGNNLRISLDDVVHTLEGLLDLPRERLQAIADEAARYEDKQRAEHLGRKEE